MMELRLLNLSKYSFIKIKIEFVYYIDNIQILHILLTSNSVMCKKKANNFHHLYEKLLCVKLEGEINSYLLQVLHVKTI